MQTESNFPTTEQLENELARENYRKRYSKTFKSTVFTLIVAAAVAVLLAMLFFPLFKIYGTSMSPTVSEGDVVAVIKGSSFKCGDVVVLSFNNKILVKRVIAGPGQWVDIDKDGNVFVDGKMIDEPYLTEKALGECTLKLPYQVGEGRYFLMGDNRSASLDSRNASIGGIADEQIIGKAFLRLWPIKKIGAIYKK